jgi:hypothetical protein
VFITCSFHVCVFITVVPIIKLFAWGEGDSGGHVLRETMSRGLCGLVCPSRTNERGGEGDCDDDRPFIVLAETKPMMKEGGGGEGERERESCVFITEGPIIKLCCCCLLLQYLIQICESVLGLLVVVYYCST